MANDNFFQEDKVEDQQQEEQVTNIKLGEKEYSQEELQRLVGLGEQAVELESRWDTKIDRLMPEFSRSREELKSLRAQIESQAQTKIEQKEEQGGDLSEEEKAKIIRAELKKYGAMFEEDFEDKYLQRRSGEKLLERTQEVITKATSQGLPNISVEELLTYMADPENPKNPEKAYKLMFEKQIKEQEMAKLQSIKPAGIWAESSSTAGAKQPNQVAITKDNLGSLLDEVLTRGGGQ